MIPLMGKTLIYTKKYICNCVKYKAPYKIVGGFNDINSLFYFSSLPQACLKQLLFLF
jgi:hypothetical protein